MSSSNNSSSVFDFSLFWFFPLNTEQKAKIMKNRIHRYDCSIDGMEYLQQINEEMRLPILISSTDLNNLTNLNILGCCE